MTPNLSAITAAALLLTTTLLSSYTAAYQAGDIILRFGAATVAPNDDSSSLRLNGTSLAGSEVSVGNDTQLGIVPAYMLTDHLAIELLAATPFEHDLAYEIPTLGVDADLGSVKHLPPTLTLLWHPLPPGSRFQPYLGGGINFTTFFDESESSEAESAVGARNLDLDDSVGFALRAGFDYQLSDHWVVNAGVWYLDIDSDASLDTALGRVKVDVDIDPTVYMVGLGYRF